MGVWLCCSSGESEALELPVYTHVTLLLDTSAECSYIHVDVYTERLDYLI